jgi:hypothetical protein
MVEPGATIGRRRPPTAAAIREQAVTFHEYLAKARHHDAPRAGERDRLLRDGRRARTARHHRTGPAAGARRPARLLFPRALAYPRQVAHRPKTGCYRDSASLVADRRSSVATTQPTPPERNGTAMNHANPIEHQAQHIDELVSWTGRERLRILWYRVRLIVSEMNYAVRRLTELQTRLP